MEIFSLPAFWIAIAALSEIIALYPSLKSNSIIQLAFQILDVFKKKKGT